jgi:hypothetical protein
MLRDYRMATGQWWPWAEDAGTMMRASGKLATGSGAMLVALIGITLFAPMSFGFSEPVAAQTRNRAPAATQSVRSNVEDERPNAVQTRPLPDIVARIQSTPPYGDMDYLGVADYDTRNMVYVLRFLDGRRVVVVNVDARSGRILSSAR